MSDRKKLIWGWVGVITGSLLLSYGLIGMVLEIMKQVQ